MDGFFNPFLTRPEEHGGVVQESSSTRTRDRAHAA